MAGVLLKYDWGKAWRPRLFVLRGGVLGYWPLGGAPAAAGAAAALDALRAEGSVVTLVGAQAAMLDRSRRTEDGESASSVPDPSGEIALSVARFQPSSSDARKLYVHTGNRKVELRAESREDRDAWLAALATAKRALPAASPGVRPCAATPRDAPAGLPPDAAARLEALGAPPAAVALAAALVADASRAAAAARADADAARARVAALANEKRALETELVVERGLANRAARVAGARTGSPPRSLNPADAGSADPLSLSGWRDAGADTDDSLGGGRRDGDDDDDRTSSSSSAWADAASDAASLAPPSHTSTSHRAADDLPLPAWLASAPPPPPRRDRLPPPAQAERTYSLWSLIKECVGRDLTRVCLPVYFNEPLSALQKLAEDMEFSTLLDEAISHPPGSIERALRVAAFAVSAYAGTANRGSKPFNPLLGETFELVRPDRGFRFIAEKVVHHPTVIAAAAEGRGWRFEGDADVRSKFWGRSIELTPVGILTLTFDDGEAYTWSKVTTSISNLIIGKPSIDHGGTMRVVSSLPEGVTVRVKFVGGGLLSRRDPRAVTGHVERAGVRLPGAPTLVGTWDAGLDVVDAESGARAALWRAPPAPPDPTRCNLTAWAIQLNEITPIESVPYLCPTDCRLRPDQAALERGEHDKANAAKQRLEKKQRAARAAAERGDPLRPRWFAPVEGAVAGKGPVYRFTGEYWACRERGEWPRCRDIFGEDDASPPQAG